jgi:hypothetical protein
LIATTVDADATLTYHSFAMSPPFPRARAAMIVVGLLGAISLASCATSEEATKPITYSLTAKQNYDKGVAELKDENYPEAQK